MQLATLLERLSAGPARIFGLERPRISAGAPANLVLLDLGAVTRVTADGFRSRSANSWLLGRTLRGRVTMTVAAGAVVYDGRRLDGARPGAEAPASPAAERE